MMNKLNSWIEQNNIKSVSYILSKNCLTALPVNFTNRSLCQTSFYIQTRTPVTTLFFCVFSLFHFHSQVKFQIFSIWVTQEIKLTKLTKQVISVGHTYIFLYIKPPGTCVNIIDIVLPLYIVIFRHQYFKAKENRQRIRRSVQNMTEPNNFFFVSFPLEFIPQQFCSSCLTVCLIHHNDEWAEITRKK